jgi:MarR family 2-MHQ and catechol resistance regulon transcriptional repressor
MSIFEELGFDLKQINKNEELLYNIARTCLFLTKEFSELYKKFGLTPVKFNALALIKRLGKDKGLSQTEISEKLIVSGANVTGLIDRLEKDKLVVRMPDARDRRLKRIRITRKGEKLLDKAWPSHLEKIDSLMEHLSSDEKSEVIGYLTEIRKKLE